MFEKYTERARQVLIQAHEEAREHNHHAVTCKHLLVGIEREGEGVAARALMEFDITIDDLRAALPEDGKSQPKGQIPFSPKAKDALDQALRESIALGHNYIGTEHILLGLSRTLGGVEDASDKEIRDLVIGWLDPTPSKTKVNVHIRGSRAMIGEHGPEKFLPVRKLPGTNLPWQTPLWRAGYKEGFADGWHEAQKRGAA